jgi:dihydroneopterin aldolase
MDVIRIDALELACIVGVRPRERRRKQIVRVHLELGLPLSQAGRSGRIAHTCDYSRVIDQVTALLQFREYQLIEVATEELTAMIFGVHENVAEATIQLEKPAALGGRARAAAVRITRRRADRAVERSERGGVERLTLLETHEAGLYLFGLEPGQSFTFESQHAARRLEWLVTGELQCDAGAQNVGDLPQARLEGARVVNTGTERSTLFVCTTPALPAF